MSVVLRASHLLLRLLVVGSRDRYPVADVVAADDRAARMHTGVTDIALKHLRIFDGGAEVLVGRGGGISHLRHTGDDILQVHLHPVGQAVRDCLTQVVRHFQVEFTNTCHVLDSEFRSHTAISDDMCHFLRAVFLRHPLQHFSASVVVEVHINIGEGYSVGVEETLKKEVVLDGVDHRDAETVGDGASGCRPTSGTDPHAQFLLCRIDIILHHKEITWESHRLHDMQLELYLLCHVLRQRVAIQTFGAVIRELGKIVCLELDAVEFVITAQTLDFLITLLAAHHHVAVLILGEFIIQLFL